MWLPVTKRRSKARARTLDADCCSGTIKCRSRGINSQSHFALRFVPSRHINFIFYIKVKSHINNIVFIFLFCDIHYNGVKGW